MLGKRQEIARFQSDFYRDYYHKLLRALIISIAVMLILIVAIIYRIIFTAPSIYYASTTEGKIIRMVPNQ